MCGVPLLECVFSEADVVFFFFGCRVGDCSLIDYTFLEAIAIHRACVFFPAVTVFDFWNVLFSSVLPEDLLIVVGDCLFHVGHAAV